MNFFKKYRFYFTLALGLLSILFMLVAPTLIFKSVPNYPKDTNNIGLIGDSNAAGGWLQIGDKAVGLDGNFAMLYWLITFLLPSIIIVLSVLGIVFNKKAFANHFMIAIAALGFVQIFLLLVAFPLIVRADITGKITDTAQGPINDLNNALAGYGDVTLGAIGQSVPGLPDSTTLSEAIKAIEAQRDAAIEAVKILPHAGPIIASVLSFLTCAFGGWTWVQNRKDQKTQTNA
jgi:hypothetical protein